MNQMLTIQEIESRYPSQWILLENPQTDDHMHVVAGKVLWHSPDRDEVYRKAVELKPKHSAFLCTIPTPEDVVFVI